MNLRDESFTEQQDAFFQKHGARVVQVKDGVIVWDGKEFFNEHLKPYREVVAWLSEGEDITGRKYRVLTCHWSDGTWVAREVQPRRTPSTSKGVGFYQRPMKKNRQTEFWPGARFRGRLKPSCGLRTGHSQVAAMRGTCQNFRSRLITGRLLKPILPFYEV